MWNFWVTQILPKIDNSKRQNMNYNKLWTQRDTINIVILFLYAILNVELNAEY